GCRCAAVEALQGRANLTKGMLQNIAARLEDEDHNARCAAVEALQGQADLTEEMLQNIAARLEDRDSSVRGAVIEMLLNQPTLSLEVLGSRIKSLYHALLHRSFEEHLYWFPSFISVGLRHVSLSCKQED
ncbi:hypothetical protein B0J11DRAFT_416609, partial [Dendryphion nanum]